jgi:hypothetical protein
MIHAKNRALLDMSLDQEQRPAQCVLLASMPTTKRNMPTLLAKNILKGCGRKV